MRFLSWVCGTSRYARNEVVTGAYRLRRFTSSTIHVTVHGLVAVQAPDEPELVVYAPPAQERGKIQKRKMDGRPQGKIPPGPRTARDHAGRRRWINPLAKAAQGAPKKEQGEAGP